MSIASYRLPLLSTGSPAQSAGLLDADASPEEVVVAYHERTKHQFHRYAASLGYMDWATQPAPFRRYSGADLVRLPLPEPGRLLPYWQLYALEGVPPVPLSLESRALFLRYALSLTAWKHFHETTWSLRANPSSGNLHPTGGYAVRPAIERLGDAPAVYHYAPKEHALGVCRRTWGWLQDQQPERAAEVKQLAGQELKAMLDRGEVTLFDVRPEDERARARIAGSRALDAAGQEYLMGLDRHTAVAFYCHHGIRSQAAAEQVLREGFRNVYNLKGGVDAWSQSIDPSVPRY